MKKTSFAALGLALSIGLAPSAFAATKSVTGNLVDTFCYTTIGAHGPSHKQCALNCAKAGIPVGLVEKGTSKMLILLPPKNDSAMPDSVVQKMESEVTVTGQEYRKDGVTFLTVESVK